MEINKRFIFFIIILLLVGVIFFVSYLSTKNEYVIVEGTVVKCDSISRTISLDTYKDPLELYGRYVLPNGTIVRSHDSILCNYILNKHVRIELWITEENIPKVKKICLAGGSCIVRYGG